MTGEPATSLSLREELDAGYTAANTPATDSNEVNLDGAPPAGPLVPELPPLEAPAVWGQKYKESFGKLSGNPELRPVAEAWQEHWKEQQGYITKRDQEYADYRKRLDPVYERIQPYENFWRQQGMEPAQGISQIMSYAEALAENPQATLMQLAEMYGVDLGQLVAEQPYVDPQVSALEQRLAQFEQSQQQWAQQQQQQVHHRLTEEIQSFATATDEQGTPKAPHFDRVFDRMLGLARGGLAQNIQDAYDMAVRLDGELQAEIAQKSALSEAATRAAQAKKALDASKTVNGKSTAEGAPPQRSLRDELAAGLEAAGFQ